LLSGQKYFYQCGGAEAASFWWSLGRNAIPAPAPMAPNLMFTCIFFKKIEQTEYFFAFSIRIYNNFHCIESEVK
jgi:hypothetical protein